MRLFEEPTSPNMWGENWYRLTQAEYEELYEALVYDVGTDWAIALADCFNYQKNGYYWGRISQMSEIGLNWLEENGFVYDLFPFVSSQFPLYGG
ncbi:MAG: hypothetical protein IJK24_01785 [Oscillospiraceae bacterium]|nr:hypothetical protein [Oscillospiraceae bacterium]